MLRGCAKLTKLARSNNVLFFDLSSAFTTRTQVYLQIMKQLTNNPKPDSTAKGWQVMCMGCSTFLPSMDFENYLLNFILEKCQIEGAEVGCDGGLAIECKVLRSMY